MKLVIDTEAGTVTCSRPDAPERTFPLYSGEGFRAVSDVWLRQQWNQMHWRSFSWFGLQMMQFPEDVLRLQEVLVALRPDVIVETGVHGGGSTAFFASVCRLLGHGRVISIDITISAEVRRAVEAGPFADLVTLIEGDSAAQDTVAAVRRLIRPGERAFVFLDSDHSRAHVLRELEAYADLVAEGCYMVATDGVMGVLADTPNGLPQWREDNPAEAARDFAARHAEFAIRRPRALFGEEHVVETLTYWPDAWLLRLPTTR
jgi:cephalosporin hydroxylase